MAHEIYWMKPDRVLYVSYQGHQNVETLTETLDAMANEMDKANCPIFVLINWLEVTECNPKALLQVKGHRAYSHPNAARGVLVGMNTQAQFENEVTAVKTRKSKNTQYFKTMDEALNYLEFVLADDDDAVQQDVS